MELLLDYKQDRNNGISTISSIVKQVCVAWGEPAMDDNYLVAPIAVSNPYNWQLLRYKYNSVVDNWIFQQLIEIDTALIGIVRVAMTDNIIAILGCTQITNDHVCYIYKQDEFEQWSLDQTLTIPFNGAVSNYSQRISAYGDYIVVADWDYTDSGTGRTGTVFVYQTSIGTYSLVTTIVTPTTNIRFGESVTIRNGSIIVGAPYNTTASSQDGTVYIYDGSGSSWSLVHTENGEAFLNGHFGWTLQAYIEGATVRLLVGAPGVNSNTGRIYFFHRVGAVWSLNTQLDAPPAYQLAGNTFGSHVSIWDGEAVVSALGEGAVYLYKFGGALWAVDVLDGTANPARFTTGGVTNYGQFVAQGVDYAFTVIGGDGTAGNGLLMKRPATGWNISTFIYTDNLFVKKTTDESFYHLASGNETIIFKLETLLSGRYQVELTMANSLEQIGPHNNKVYFVENGIYKVATLAESTYTGAQLAAHVQTQMNAISTWPSNYTFTYDVGTNKFYAVAQNPFAFGSSDSNSLKYACQNKVMGFYDNHNSIVHIAYVSDTEAQLTGLSQIGVNIVEGVPITPIRNNSVFAEVGMIATLDTGDNKYKVLVSEDQRMKIPEKTSQLSFAFLSLDGGAYLHINTNDLQVVLRSID